MALTRDPHNREYTHLHHAVNLNDKRIIEIGCGDGRLTALYQEMAQSVVGVDLAEQALQTAHQNLHDKANFALVDATQLPFRKDKFDVAIFAWSLWCFTHAGMVHTLNETWRVLHQDGVLVDLRPRHTGLLIECVQDESSEVLTCHDDPHREGNDKAADDAINTVISDGLFSPIRNVHFEYIRHYDTNIEVLDYFAQRNPPMAIDDAVIKRIKQETTASFNLVSPMQLMTYRKVTPVADKQVV